MKVDRTYFTENEAKKINLLIPRGCDGNSRNALISVDTFTYRTLEAIHPSLPNVVFANSTADEKGVFCSKPNYNNPACLICNFRGDRFQTPTRLNRIQSLLGK
jgi:hypothetical protein